MESSPVHSETRTRILDVAEDLIQARGYNGVSFRDLAEVVQIKSASIHYHFPTKADLATALVDRYRERFGQARERISQAGGPAMHQLEEFAKAVRGAFQRRGRMCLCGVLAAEASTLEPRTVESVQAFFTENEQWLTKVLASGKASGELRFDNTPKQAAMALFGAIEGALMSAWTFKDEDRLTAAMRWFLRGLFAVT